MRSNRRNTAVTARDRAARRGTVTVWQMWGDATPATSTDGPGSTAAGSAGPALSQRLRDAQTRRVAEGEDPAWAPGGSGGELHDEMLQFVLTLEERSLGSRGVVPGAPAGPLPRRVGPSAAPLPRRPHRGSAVAPVATSSRDTCPSCGGRRLRVDELDLDAAECVRTCVECATTFTAPI